MLSFLLCSPLCGVAGAPGENGEKGDAGRTGKSGPAGERGEKTAAVSIIWIGEVCDEKKRITTLDMSCSVNVLLRLSLRNVYTRWRRSRMEPSQSPNLTPDYFVWLFHRWMDVRFNFHQFPLMNQLITLFFIARVISRKHFPNRPNFLSRINHFLSGCRTIWDY